MPRRLPLCGRVASSRPTATTPTESGRVQPLGWCVPTRPATRATTGRPSNAAGEPSAALEGLAGSAGVVECGCPGRGGGGPWTAIILDDERRRDRPPSGCGRVRLARERVDVGSGIDGSSRTGRRRLCSACRCHTGTRLRRYGPSAGPVRVSAGRSGTAGAATWWRSCQRSKTAVHRR